MNQLFDTRPERPGYRLQQLEISNWGTFDSRDGRIYTFRPEGRTSLLVGHNGSGKSTLVDAITTLLGNNRSYNLAAGAKSRERTPKSYIKGAFDRVADGSQNSVVKFLRPKGDTLTALSAQFCDEKLDKTFTILQVLYLKNGDIEDRVYAIADSPQQLAATLSGLVKSDQVRSHLKQHGFQTTKKPSEYLGWIAKRTGMQTKAIDMFNQTVAVKNIDSLTKFIRDHMLEATNWKDKVQSLLLHFNDLSSAHQELERARKQIELLQPVRKTGNKYRDAHAKLILMEENLAAADLFFADQFVRLFQPEIQRQQANAKAMAATIDQMEAQLEQLAETIRQLKNEIDLAGGDRIKQIPNLIQIQQAELRPKQARLGQFAGQLKLCGLPSEVADDRALSQTRVQLQKLNQLVTDQQAIHQDEYETAIGGRASVGELLRCERAELTALQQRRTNLPAKFIAMRTQICENLNLNETDLPFAAELLAVKPDQQRWEASIEMVLNSFSLSLLVPDRYYQRVRTYLERNRINDNRGQGARIDYIRVGVVQDASGDRLDPRSLTTKLNFKSRHDLTPWVRGEIVRRFNFTCCENIDEFNEVPRMAVTANRHVKFNSQSHKKDDRQRTVDPRYFVLGWDNTDKKNRIANRIKELETETSALDQQVKNLDAMLGGLRDKLQAIEAGLAVTSFDMIDVRRHWAEIESLREEQRELESNDLVKPLRKRLDAAEKEVKSTKAERDKKLEEQGALKREIELHLANIDREKDKLAGAETSGELAVQQPRFARIQTALGETALTFGDFDARRRSWESGTREQLRKSRQPVETLKEKLTVAQSKFLRQFPEQASDLSETVEALDSFLALLQRLEREDLPQYIARFEQRLNDQVTSEIATFRTALRLECQEIDKKIKQLNIALADVEYDQHRGTYMRLDPRRINDGEIEQFRRSLDACMDESLDSSKAANEARFDRIKSLVEKLADKERANWRNKVIDVRNWFNFVALEISRETEDVLSSYDGSSGQSGGEKAKLAFTILVAAIAYQFDIDPSGQTPGRFQFVVVDEMFSKVDDQNATYALKLFQQFGLQLLIVAPLDAKARITEPFVDRYLHVVKSAESSRSHLFSMTAREYQEVIHELPGA